MRVLLDSILRKMANYDEDLHENHFFKALVETNNALYSKAADNKWMVSFRTFA